MSDKNGLVGRHGYTVVDYNAGTDMIRLRNPQGTNPEIVRGADKKFYLGKTDADQPTPPVNNGYFWMSLSDFAKLFSEICYEQ